MGKKFQKIFFAQICSPWPKTCRKHVLKNFDFLNFFNFHQFPTFFKIPKITRSRPTDPPITPTGHPSWSLCGRLAPIPHGFPNFVPPVYPPKFFGHYKTISRKLTEAATTLKFFLLPPETGGNDSSENQRSISTTFENFQKSTVWPFSQFPWKFQNEKFFFWKSELLGAGLGGWHWLQNRPPSQFGESSCQSWVSTQLEPCPAVGCLYISDSMMPKS